MVPPDVTDLFKASYNGERTWSLRRLAPSTSAMLEITGGEASRGGPHGYLEATAEYSGAASIA